MKPLLCLFAMCLCTGLTHAASAASPQTTPLAPPQDTTQAPAPIVRPKPIIIKPRPVTGATGSTGGAVLIEPIRPRAAVPSVGASGSTGSPGAVRRPRPATAASGATGSSGASGILGSTGLPTRKPAVLKPPTPPPTSAVPGRVQPAGTAPVTFNRTTIVLDPAHGGVDGGSRITDALQEKDVDLAFAFKLRSLLTARGFNVVLTRDTDAAAPSDNPAPLTLDDRAGTANHLHPVACLLLHSTGSGKGVHLYSSELAPSPIQPPVVPWLTAQAPWVEASRALQKQLGTALTRAEIPLVLSRASIRPLDSLTCPALVLELAPNGSDKESVNDGTYQQRIANAIASAMIFWQNLAQPPDRQLPAPPVTAIPTPSTAASTPGDQP